MHKNRRGAPYPETVSVVAVDSKEYEQGLNNYLVASVSVGNGLASDNTLVIS